MKVFVGCSGRKFFVKNTWQDQFPLKKIDRFLSSRFFQDDLVKSEAL